MMATTLASPQDLQANGRSHAARGRGCMPVISKSPDRLGGGFALAIAPVILTAVIPHPDADARVQAGKREHRSRCRLHSQDIAAGTRRGSTTGSAPVPPL